MTIIASNFGNLHALVTGVPTLILATILAATAITKRNRSLALISSLICLAVATWFYVSLDLVIEKDRIMTLLLIFVSAITGLTTPFLAFRQKKS